MCSYSLDQKEHVVLSLWSFQGARRPAARLAENDHAEARSLKTQQRADCYVEVDVVSRRTESSDEDPSRGIDINELGACRSKSAPASLERR